MNRRKIRVSNIRESVGGWGGLRMAKEKEIAESGRVSCFSELKLKGRQL
jgi:hypothetical protein